MVGRPSKAPERRDQILDAMEVCVRAHGIGQASMRRIADQSGLSLQMVSHYFGNKEKLVLAFVMRVGEKLAVEVDSAISGATPQAELTSFVQFLCSDRYKRIPGNDVIGREIWGLAERDTDIRSIVWGWYDRSISSISETISKAYPNASPTRCRETAYAILCLTEANEFFSGIGDTSLPSKAAEAAALGLLDLLAMTEDTTTAS